MDIIEKIKRAIIELKESSRPETLGQPKKGKLKGTLAYKINGSTRILYSVSRDDGTIKVSLLRVCNHKQVYGKD